MTPAWHSSWVNTWIFDDQAFSFGNIEQFDIGTHKCGSHDAEGREFVAYLESTCELHSIICTQSMVATKIACTSIDAICDLNKAVLPLGILTKEHDIAISVGFADTLTEILFPRLATKRCYCLY